MNFALTIFAMLSLCGAQSDLVPATASVEPTVSEVQDERDSKPALSAAQVARLQRKLRARLSEGKLKRARELLAVGANPNSRFKKEGGRTLLHAAVEHANIREMELLLEFGADVNAVTVSGWSPLHFAMGDPKRDVVELLLKHQSSLEASDKFGATVLHYAAQFGEARILALLLPHASHELAERSDLRGWTALDRAVVFERAECVQLLRKHLSKTLPVSAPVPDSKDGGLFALLMEAESASDTDRQVALDITPFLNSKKSVARVRPIFWITRSIHNGIPSERNVVHLVCAVWADGWYMIRPKYFASENASVLPELHVGFLSAEKLSTFLEAIEETDYFNRFLPGPYRSPCSGDISVSLLSGGKQLPGNEHDSAIQSQASVMGLPAQVRQDASRLLVRLLSRVFDPQTQPIGELPSGQLIRGYNSENPSKTRWWY